MPSTFYQKLDQIEQMLGDFLTIEDLGEGLILVNGIMINTNMQMEMLTPTYFTVTSADNPIIDKFMAFFKDTGILPHKTPHIPIIRDIPLRLRTAAPTALVQKQVFAKFLEQDIVVNQWTHLFKAEFEALKASIKQFYSDKARSSKAKIKQVLLDEQGMPLKSGGYFITEQVIRGIHLNLFMPESYEARDIEAVIAKSLNATSNTIEITKHLLPSLLERDQIAFNVRGVSDTRLSREAIQNNGFGGGHHYFLLLDRKSRTLYSINNSRAADDEVANMQFFKDQIDLFLESIGDRGIYELRTIAGKSRQPEGQETLSQVCNVSQFCHYAAILSGISPESIENTVPPKVTTLLYLLQYISQVPEKELLNMLDILITHLNAKRPEIEPTKDIIPPQPPEQTPTIFSWLIEVLASIAERIFTIAVVAIASIAQKTAAAANHLGQYFGCFFQHQNRLIESDNEHCLASHP